MAIARSKGLVLYACNNAYKLAPDCALLYSVNTEWWRHYWLQVVGLPCEKWTTTKAAADKYGLNWIAEKNAPGLSTDPNIIHHGHGSGYSLVSMAYRNGADRIVLLGYDLKYAPDYDGKARQIGSSPRHSLDVLPVTGEYPPSMQHWPSVQVRNGVHVELRDLYRSISNQGLVEVINCTPDSAIDCFPRCPIDAL